MNPWFFYLFSSSGERLQGIFKNVCYLKMSTWINFHLLWLPQKEWTNSKHTSPFHSSVRKTSPCASCHRQQHLKNNQKLLQSLLFLFPWRCMKHLEKNPTGANDAAATSSSTPWRRCSEKHGPGSSGLAEHSRISGKKFSFSVDKERNYSPLTPFFFWVAALHLISIDLFNQLSLLLDLFVEADVA